MNHVNDIVPNFDSICLLSGITPKKFKNVFSFRKVSLNNLTYTVGDATILDKSDCLPKFGLITLILATSDNSRYMLYI